MFKIGFGTRLITSGTLSNSCVDELEQLCACGHMNPEHSLFGTCRGCLDCETHADDHPYQQCGCRKFSLIDSAAHVRLHSAARG